MIFFTILMAEHIVNFFMTSKMSPSISYIYFATA